MGVEPRVCASNLLAMRQWIALAALVVLTACNQSSAAVTGVADIAVKSGDVPKGLQKCSASGDIDSFLNAVKSKDPSTYTSTMSEWDKAKSHGATSAEVVFHTDSKAHCDSITNSQFRTRYDSCPEAALSDEELKSFAVRPLREQAARLAQL